MRLHLHCVLVMLPRPKLIVLLSIPCEIRAAEVCSELVAPPQRDAGLQRFDSAVAGDAQFLDAIGNASVPTTWAWRILDSVDPAYVNQGAMPGSL